MAQDAAGNRKRIVDQNRDHDQVLEERDATNVFIVANTYGDDLISPHRGGTYYLYDGLGSTRALSDAIESVADTYACGAYSTFIDSTGTTRNSYRAPLKIVFFRDCGVSSVLESSCIPIYTAVLRAVLPCTHEKIQILKVAYKYTVEQCPVLDQYCLRAKYYDPAAGRFTAMDSFPCFLTQPITHNKQVPLWKWRPGK